MRLLLQFTFIIIVILGMGNVYKYFEKQKSMHDTIQAINQTTQACTIDLQNDNNTICD